MPGDRMNRLLDEFSAVTDAAPRPDTRRITMRSRFPVATLSAASVIVVVIALAAVVLGRSGPALTVGASQAPITATTTPSAAPSRASSAPVAVASAPVRATPRPSAVTCDLAARIVSWEGAAGQRIATVDLTNRGVDCLVATMDRPQLVDGSGAVLIDGAAAPREGAVLQLASGGHLTTLVSVGNWCGREPVAPISLAFVHSNGERLVAAPVSPTDLTLPPCNGPTVAATISMHPWAP